MSLITTIYKALRKIKEYTFSIFYTPIARLILFLNGAKVESGIKVRGILSVHITRRGKVIIGKNCRINSGNNHNRIGRQQRNLFWVEGTMIIGENVGISCSAIVCHKNITIGNNVTIGGNTVIYDTDFHPLDPVIRQNNSLDSNYITKASIVIEDNVFIGAHTTILKGVTIGKNSIVGACSVVTKNIPPNEIWGGYPAKFIKSLDQIVK